MATKEHVFDATGSLVLGQANAEDGAGWLVSLTGVFSGTLQFKGYYTLGSEQSAIPAGNTLTVTGGAQPSDGNQVVLGSTTYTFKTALSSGPTVANEVLIGSDASGSLDNLVAAINGTGTIGTDYSLGTVANTLATAVKATTSTMWAYATATGAGGNSVVSTENITGWAWAKTTLDQGLNPDLTLLAYENQVDRTIIAGTTTATVTVPVKYFVWSDRCRVVLYYTKTSGTLNVKCGTCRA